MLGIFSFKAALTWYLEIGEYSFDFAQVFLGVSTLFYASKPHFRPSFPLPLFSPLISSLNMLTSTLRPSYVRFTAICLLCPRVHRHCPIDLDFRPIHPSSPVSPVGSRRLSTPPCDRLLLFFSLLFMPL